MVWFNQRLPQTLVVATALLYLRAFIALINPPPTGLFEATILRIGLALLITFGSAAGAFGIANTKKWGYYLGIAASLVPFVIRFQLWRVYDLGFAIEWNVVGLVFQVALVAALLHRESAEYQRVYFE